MEASTETPVESTSIPGGTGEAKSVAYESFDKAVREAKNARERARLLEEEVNSYKTKELEAQGKHEEVIASLRKELNETKTKAQQEREQRLWEKVTGAVSTEALKHGCQSPDKLIKLLDQSDFELLKTDGGDIQKDTLSKLIDKAKKENSFLFKQPAVPMNDTVPGGSKPAPKKKASEMTKEEIEAELLKLGKK